jgi:hypothetical protein
VQGNRQLDHAEAGTEVTAGLADGVEQLLAQLIGEWLELRLAQPPQTGRGVGTVEQGRQRAFAGNLMKRRGHQANRYEL